MQNEFEKSVREKMDELHFVPTEPVWSKIEAQIRPRKDRRRIILWLPLLLVFLAGGSYLYLQNQPQQTKSDKGRANVEKGNTSKLETTVIRAKGTETERETERERGEETSGLNQTIAMDKKLAVELETPKKDSRQTALAAKSFDTGNKTGFAAKSKSAQINAKQNDVTVSEKNSKTLHEQPKQSSPSLPNEYQNGLSREVNRLDKKEAVQPQLLNAEPEHSAAQEEGKEVTPDSTQQLPAVQQNIQDKRKKWKVAVTAHAGRSGISDGFNIFSLEKDAMDPMTSGGNPVPPSPIVSSDPATPTIAKGLGLGLGVAFRKEISNRLFLSLGAQYNYHGHNITVGKDSFLVNIGNQFTSPNGSVARVYRNSYHFIGIPVELEWQAFRRIPLQIQGGLSLQQLFSTNALVYNSQSRLFLNKKDAFRKTQLFAGFGINYTLKVGKSSMQVGPQLQYGLTQMESKGKNRHLYLAGLRTQFNF